MSTERSPLLSSPDSPQTNGALLVAEFKEGLRVAKENSIAWWGETTKKFRKIGLGRYLFNTALGGFFAFCYAWISNSKLAGVAADERWPLNLDTALLNGALVELVVNHLWEEIKMSEEAGKFEERADESPIAAVPGKGKDRAWLLAALTLSLGLAAPVAAPLFSSGRAAGLQRFLGYGLFGLRTGLVASSMVHLKKLWRGMSENLTTLWKSGWGKVKAIFGTGAAFCISAFYILSLRPGIGAAAQDFFPEGVCQDLDAEHQAILLGSLEAIGMAASIPFYWEYVRGGIKQLLSLKNEKEAAILLIALCSVVVGYAQASSQNGAKVPEGCSNTEFEFETTHPYKLTRLIVSLAATFLMNFRSAVKNDHEKTGVISVLVSGSSLVLEEVVVKPLVWLFKPFVDFTLLCCRGRRSEEAASSVDEKAAVAPARVGALDAPTSEHLVNGRFALHSGSPGSPFSIKYQDKGTPQPGVPSQQSCWRRAWSGLQSAGSRAAGLFCCKSSTDDSAQRDPETDEEGSSSAHFSVRRVGQFSEVSINTDTATASDAIDPPSARTSANRHCCVML